MALGLLNKSYSSRVIAYDDEQTPINLTGVKMLPIWQRADGTTLNESLDIIAEIDPTNLIPRDILDEPAKRDKVEAWLAKLGPNIHNLAMPYWMWTPEFTPSARQYFEIKKSAKRGPFKLLARKRPQFESALKIDLEALENELSPWFLSDTFSIADIMLASHLWGMYVVPEFRFSDKIHAYLQSVKLKCDFQYHVDFWRD